MSLATLYSRAQVGMAAPLIRVEVHLSAGLPGFSIVGMPEIAVKESKERVRSALLNCQFEFPQQRITVNLAPADLPKEGGRYDLAIALGLLMASEQVHLAEAERYEVFGELGLSGELRPVSGLLPAAMAVAQAGRTVICPVGNAEEAVLISQLEVLASENLLALAAHFAGHTLIEPYQSSAPASSQPQSALDLADIKGQEQAKRALEIAAAGGHNMLLCGPPGSGKSMLAQRLTGILPRLSEAQALETAAVYSVAAQPRKRHELFLATFRAPHHTASAVSLVGGGSNPRPGEVSLAHHGVLFLDELPEYNRQVLEVLREPLENGEILISRASRQAVFPAQFQLIAAMNPCPCGYSGSSGRECRCSLDQIKRYQNKISGPLLDRIDLHIHMDSLSQVELLQTLDAQENSAQVAERIIKARGAQVQRQQRPNQALTARECREVAALTFDDQKFLAQAIDRLKLSARAHDRILRVARTIADLAGEPQVNQAHLLEALSYRGNLFKHT